MPPKTREYYLSTSPSRDFTWFFFGVTPRPVRSKPQPPPPERFPGASHAKTTSATEEPGQALMAPADVKLRQTLQARSEPTRPKRSRPKKGGARSAALWSEWYVSEDGSHFWRARQAQNKTWDYQFTPGYQEPAGVQVVIQPPTEGSTPTTSSSELSQPLSPTPGDPPASPRLNTTPNPTSPKSSWPTIITTSTGQPTEDLTASSSRTLVTLPKEGDDIYQLDATSMALVPLAATTGSPATSNKTNKSSGNKRPVGPVMRLLQEGRSRKNKATADAVATSTAAGVIGLSPVTLSFRGDGGGVADKPQKHHAGQGPTMGNNYNKTNTNVNTNNSNRSRNNGSGNGGGGGSAPLVRNRTTTSALAKKLHAKVKSEKELKVDPKRRVRAWLKGVEVDLEPIPLDAWGFPVYR